MPDTSSRCRVSRTHHGRFPLILSARALARAVPTEGTGADENARHLVAQETGETRKELVMSMVDHLIERGWLAHGPYNQVEITDRAWPLCVAVMAAMLLVAAYIEGGTVMVP